MQKPSSVMVISLKHLAAEKYSSIYAGSLAKKIKNQLEKTDEPFEKIISSYAYARSISLDVFVKYILPFVIKAPFDRHGANLLHWASRKNKIELRNELLEYYPHDFLPDKAGKTSQQYILYQNLPKSIEYTPVENTQASRTAIAYELKLFFKKLNVRGIYNIIEEDYPYYSEELNTHTNAIPATYHILIAPRSVFLVHSKCPTSRRYSQTFSDFLDTNILWMKEKELKNHKNLIVHYLNPDNLQAPHNSTLLHLAVQYDNVPLTRMLLAMGANPNDQNHLGSTPLHMGLATLSAHYLLQSPQLDLTIQNFAKQTPLSLARSRYNDPQNPAHRKVIDRLLKKMKMQSSCLLNILD